MSDTAFYSQPAYILHQQAYRETSLIIDVLTKDLGRFSLLAKGVRKNKSKTASLLRPFVSLSLSFVGKSDLKTLTVVETNGTVNDLTGLALYSAFYINELICVFLPKDDPHPNIFQDYQHALTQLEKTTEIEAALRTFELNLLESIGYGINLDYDLYHDKRIDPGKHYIFSRDGGFTENVDGKFSGAAIQSMNQRHFHDPIVLNQAKRLMRVVIDGHLEGKRLKSRSVINSIIKRQ